jgi:hypothetical protein
MNATNNNLIASNYKLNQVAIEWRLLDKNIMTLTTAVAKKETQQNLKSPLVKEIVMFNHQ